MSPWRAPGRVATVLCRFCDTEAQEWDEFESQERYHSDMPTRRQRRTPHAQWSAGLSLRWRRSRRIVRGAWDALPAEEGR